MDMQGVGSISDRRRLAGSEAICPAIGTIVSLRDWTTGGHCFSPTAIS